MTKKKGGLLKKPLKMILISKKRVLKRAKNINHPKRKLRKKEVGVENQNQKMITSLMLAAVTEMIMEVVDMVAGVETIIKLKT
jgi:hypothetical protein